MPVLLITGAASGIGAAIARQAAAPGYSLVLHTGHNGDALDMVARDVRQRGAQATTVLGDLTDAQVSAQLVETAYQTFGGLDQIVSNAGRAHKSQFTDLTEADLLAAWTLMPMAFFRLMNAAMPFLKASGQGRIVAISSFVAHVYGANNMLFPATAAAKAALESLAKSMAWQVAPEGITVNCVVPGFVRKDASGHAATTPEAMESAARITPNARIATPQDIADTVCYLLGPGARHITGQLLHVDGGLTL